MSCTIELNKEKIKIDNLAENASFTEEAFDAWLYQNKEFIKEQLKYAPSEFDPMFALDLTEIQKRKQNFEDFRSKMFELRRKAAETKNRQEEAKLGNNVDISDGLITAAVTRVYTYIGNEKDINRPVANWNAISEQENNEIRRTIASEEEQKKAMDARDTRSMYAKLDGWIFGAMVQDYLTKKTNNGDLEALRKRLDVQNTLKSLGITWNDAVRRITQAVRYNVDGVEVDVIKNIANRISKYGIQYYSEFQVFTDRLSPEFKAALDKVHKQLKIPKANGLTGFIDIVSMDSTGNTNMFDIKLSSIPIDKWWGVKGGKGENKYDEISAQQMSYFTMAQQAGYSFSGAHIIPAHAIYNGNELLRIEDEDFKTFTPTNKYAIRCQKYLPVNVKSDPKIIDNLTRDMNELFEGTELNSIIKHKEFTLDYYRKYHHEKVGNKYKIPIDARFPAKDYGMQEGQTEVYFETWNDVENFLKNTYIPRMNEIFADGNKQLAKALEEISEKNYSVETSINQLKEIAKDISKNSRIQQFVVNTFKKYVCDGWTLISNSENLLVNYGIFAFQKGGLVEMVLLDDTDIFGQYRLGAGHNKNILGNYVNDMAQNIDDIRILKAYRGNLLAMKAMVLIARNEGGWFNGKKLQAVRVVNLLYKQELCEFNDKLVNNWNELTYYYNKSHKDGYKFRTLGRDSVVSGTFALVNRANDITRLFFEKRNVHFKEHADHIEALSDESEEEILKYIRNLVAAYNVDSAEDWRKHSDEFEAYKLLTQALLAVRGFTVSMENDCGDYFQGIFINGLKTMSPAESPSSNVRILSQIESVYDKKLRDEYQKLVYPWQIAMVEMLKENDAYNAITDERELFKLCFEKENGKVSSNFCLIPPDENPELTNRPKLKALVKLFLETINEYRISDEAERDELKAQRGSLYYQVPLTKANWRNQVKQGGAWKAGKVRFQEFSDSTKDFMFGDTMSNWELKQYDDISTEKIYNPYFDISDEAQELREVRLGGQKLGDEVKVKHDVDYYELSLDTIFLRTMYAEMRSQISTEFLPLFTALRAFLAFNGNVQGANMDSIIRTVDKFIQSNVFHKRIIDPSENAIYSILGALRMVTSIMGLAGSPISFNREMMSSYIRTIINKENDPLMKTSFDADDYSEYIGKIIEDSPKNVDQHSFYCQMNYRFAMANMTSSQLASQMKTNWTNINNWASDILFLNTTAPDFVHRNAILMAVLKKRGSDKAYLQKENKELYYDPTKDKQYALYFKYKDLFNSGEESKIPESERSEAKAQKALYDTARLDWNKKYGLNLQPGDYLPDALSPAEAEAVRTYADHLFGNFDDNKKALIQKSLLGSFFLQFKTFNLQQFMQAVRAKGYTNIIRYHFRVDTNGDRIVKVDLSDATPEEKMEYGDHRYMTEKEAKEKGIPPEKITYVVDVVGGATSGKLTSSAEIIYDVMSGDQAAFNEKWNASDVYKANVKMALIDNLGLMIIAALIRLWFGEEKVNAMQEQAWWTRWSYAVLMGVAQDGPINQVVGGLLGNGTPPSIAILQSFFKNSYQVITGEKPVLYGVLNTFGATRMFTGMVSG